MLRSTRLHGRRTRRVTSALLQTTVRAPPAPLSRMLTPRAGQALIWDLTPMPKAIEDPILAYTAEKEINQLQWSSSQPDWIAIAFDRKMQILRV